MAPALLPTLAHHARSLFATALANRDPSANPTTTIDITANGPLAARSILLARDAATTASTPNPESGILHPGDINNSALFALFGIIGAGFIIVGIWFFFWAKNGGFYYKEGDWDEYKSTVLRRRGPNGTILSNATKSTKLGGGSVYKDVVDDDDDSRTHVTGSTEMTGITAGVSDIDAREKRRYKREQKERRREQKRAQKDAEKGSKNSSGGAARKVGEDGALIDHEAEQAAKDLLRSYRHERPARVGGLNKEADGSAWDGSTNPATSSRGGGRRDDEEADVTSELMQHRERTPTSTPTKRASRGTASHTPTSSKKPSTPTTTPVVGGIRKVYSTSTPDKRDDREAERIKSEARKLAERGRNASSRRDFSFQQQQQQQGTESNRQHNTRSNEGSRVPGSWAASDVGTDSDVGTKSYTHHIPGLSQTDVVDYADERRRRRANGEGGSGGGREGKERDREGRYRREKK